MVSSVSFGQGVGVFERPNLDAPQTNSRQQAPMANHPVYEEPKKKSSTGKIIAGVVGTAIAAVALLALGKKFDVFSVEKLAKATESFKDSKWISWAKKPVKAVMNGLDAAGGWINNKAEAVWNWGKNLISKPEKAEAVAEEAAAIIA